MPATRDMVVSEGSSDQRNSRDKSLYFNQLFVIQIINARLECPRKVDYKNLEGRIL